MRSYFHDLESNIGYHKIEDDYGDECPQKSKGQVCPAVQHLQSPTINKPQGRTFNNIILDLQSTGWVGIEHTYTAVYVALSRCHSLNGLKLSRRPYFCKTWWLLSGGDGEAFRNYRPESSPRVPTDKSGMRSSIIRMRSRNSLFVNKVSLISL